MLPAASAATTIHCGDAGLIIRTKIGCTVAVNLRRRRYGKQLFGLIAMNASELSAFR